MIRRTSRRAAALAVAATALLATGCSAGTAPAPAATRTPEAWVPPWSSGNTMAPSWIHGLRTGHDSGRDHACTWTIDYPEIPGAEPLTTALRRGAYRSRTAFLDYRNVIDFDNCRHPGRRRLHLEVGFTFLVASGDVVGVRQIAVDRSNYSNGLETTAYWYDGASGRVLPPTALIAEDAWPRVASALKKATTNFDLYEDSVKHAFDINDPAWVFGDLAFTPNGDLAFNFPEGAMADSSAAQAKAIVPYADARPLLSAFGRRAQRQAAHPEPRLTLTPRAPSTPPPVTD